MVIATESKTTLVSKSHSSVKNCIESMTNYNSVHVLSESHTDI